MNDLFRAEVAKQKVLRKITNRDIAKLAKMPYPTVRNFMCGASGSERVARRIAQALNMEQ